MRILVTGDCGVIGRELVKILLEAKHEVYGMDKLAPSIMDRTGNYTRLQRDLSIDSLTDEIEAISPAVVFHLAASFERTQETPEAIDHIWENDTVASHRLLNAVMTCIGLKKIVFASSYLIYQLNSYGIDPRNLCGVSKLYTERELEFLCTKLRPDVSYVNARIFRVYGCGGKEIISRWCRAKVRGEHSFLFNPENRFDFIHARDVARGLFELGFSEANGIVQLGTGISTSISEIVDMIRVTPERIEDDKQTENSVADISRLKQLTGWTPTITVSQGIKEVLAYEAARTHHIGK